MGGGEEAAIGAGLEVDVNIEVKAGVKLQTKADVPGPRGSWCHDASLRLQLLPGDIVNSLLFKLFWKHFNHEFSISKFQFLVFNLNLQPPQSSI